MESKPLLAINNLHASYGLANVLRGLSLRVEEGATVAILGPNGSGKSTLLKAIFRISDVVISQGDIRFDGHNITKLRVEDYNRSIVYLPQNLDVFPSLTVDDNLRLFIEEMHDSGHKVSITDAYTLFPILKAKRREYAGNLSGGQRRLVAFCRAFLSQPRIVLLDEPSAGLSPSALSDVCGYIRELQNHGTTLLMVEQNVSMALELTQECVVLQEGQVKLRFASADFEQKRLQFMDVFMSGSELTEKVDEQAK